MVRKGKGRKLETGEYYDSKNNRYMFQKMIDGERFTITASIKGFVFVNSCGGVWNEPCFRKLIKRIIDRQNRDAEKNNSEKLNDFCPHMARHTYTSLAYSAGADVKIVSQILGHASATVTLDTYTHLTEQKRQEQEKVINTIKIS